jgi:hypothetical protein
MDVDRSPERLVATSSGTITVAELEARVSLLEPALVSMREVADGTAETYEVMIARALELARPFGAFAMVVDLTEVTKRPRGRYLQMILHSIEDPVHIAVVQPGNLFLRGVLRFILARMSNRTSVHATRDAATAVARAQLSCESKS